MELTHFNSILMKFEAVDLGLSVYWANCNIGAPIPESIGALFAWGEIREKEDYYYDSYKWCDGSIEELTKYNSDKNYGLNGFTDNRSVLELEDDAARVHWGAPWRIPTVKEFQELMSNCYFKDKYVNGQHVIKVQSKINGNYIYFPYSDYYYWSNSLTNVERWYNHRENCEREIEHEFGGQAVAFSFGYYKKTTLYDRYNGCLIRPVCPRSYNASGQELRQMTLSGTSVPATDERSWLTMEEKSELKDFLNRWKTCRLACITNDTALVLTMGQEICVIGIHPSGVINRLKEVREKGHRITSISFTNSFARWAFTYGKNCFKGYGPYPVLFEKKMKRFQEEGLFRGLSITNQNYVILCKEHLYASRESDIAAIQEASRRYGGIKNVTITSQGICVICKNGVYYENIPENLEQKLKTLKYIPEHITFTDTGMYIICFKDGDYIYNL